MKSHITNLPAIPYEKIATLSENYHIAFYATEFQMDEIFSKYKVLLRCNPVSSLDEIIAVLKPSRPSGLELEGVSELIVTVWFHAVSGGRLDVEGVSYWVLFNNQLLMPRSLKPKQPYWFSLVGETPYMHDRNKYFKYDKPSPNNVGKATQKKLQDWADFLSGKEAAMQAYLQNTIDIHAEFFKRLDESGVQYRRNGNEVEIQNGCLKTKCELGEQKIYCHSITFDDRTCGSNRLDFILNNTISVVPRL